MASEGGIVIVSELFARFLPKLEQGKLGDLQSHFPQYAYDREMWKGADGGEHHPNE